MKSKDENHKITHETEHGNLLFHVQHELGKFRFLGTIFTKVPKKWNMILTIWVLVFRKVRNQSLLSNMQHFLWILFNLLNTPAEGILIYIIYNKEHQLWKRTVVMLCIAPLWNLHV